MLKDFWKPPGLTNFRRFLHKVSSRCRKPVYMDTCGFGKLFSDYTRSVFTFFIETVSKSIFICLRNNDIKNSKLLFIKYWFNCRSSYMKHNIWWDVPLITHQVRVRLCLRRNRYRILIRKYRGWKNLMSVSLENYGALYPCIIHQCPYIPCTTACQEYLTPTWLVSVRLYTTVLN
jgi:hypothetical protein